MQTVRDKCFDKCVTRPSSSLSSSEQQCLARCCDRYAEVCEPPDVVCALS
jgi:import inner membrane translocase subunit TIM13